MRVRYPSPVVGLAAGATAVVVITAALVPARDDVSRATPALTLVLPVLLAAAIGGTLVAIVTAVIAAMAFNIAFIPPPWTLRILSIDDVVAFGIFLVVAVVAGTLVGRLAEGRRAAEQRSRDIQDLHEQYLAVVAERERLMEEAHRIELLERADQQRSALLRSVSHDLRTPLATIRAATSDIRAGADYDPAARDELLDLVGDEAERLDRLVANLLSLSRIEAGALQPDCQAVVLEELVADRARRLARLFGQVNLKTCFPPDLPTVSADYSQLDQVVTNLLENAARHAPAGTVVLVTAVPTGPSQSGDMVEVRVSDEGPGLDAAAAEQLFKPFRAGPGSGGTGIGLAICKAIVEAHGGQIRFTAAPSGGACFAFTVPVHRG